MNGGKEKQCRVVGDVIKKKKKKRHRGITIGIIS